MQQLESATEEARQANIGVAKAKRLLKELQAQVGEAAGGGAQREGGEQGGRGGAEQRRTQRERGCV